jgi:hypothetical protein
MERKQEICLLGRISVVVISGEKIKIPDAGSGVLRHQVSRINRAVYFVELRYSFLIVTGQINLKKRVGRQVISPERFKDFGMMIVLTGGRKRPGRAGKKSAAKQQQDR